MKPGQHDGRVAPCGSARSGAWIPCDTYAGTVYVVSKTVGANMRLEGGARQDPRRHLHGAGYGARYGRRF